MFDEVEEIAFLTPVTRPPVRPVSPSPIPVPTSVAIVPMIPPDVDVEVVPVVVVPPVVLPPVVLPPLELVAVFPNRSVTSPPNTSVTTVPKKFPMSEKIPPIAEVADDVEAGLVAVDDAAGVGVPEEGAAGAAVATVFAVVLEAAGVVVVAIGSLSPSASPHVF